MITNKMNGFWNNKRVFITGVNGFIGGSLVKSLLNSGAKIFGLVRNLDCDSYLYFEKLDKKITIIQGELTDLNLLKRVISEEQIHAVFHLAAQVEVGVARENPYVTWETNVRGTYTLLEAIRENGEYVSSIVIASTDKSYGSYPPSEMPYKEDYPLIPIFPYDVSKACADMIARSYATELFDLPIVVTRFCNIYGPGQLNFSAVIPDAIRSALGYSEFIPRSDGTLTRDFIYMQDVADLYLSIGEQLSGNKKKYSGQIFNAGTNSPVQIKEVIELVYVALNNYDDHKKIVDQYEGKETTGEINCQYMDFEKVNKYFGWTPSTSFENGISETVLWYKKYLEQYYNDK